MVDTISRTKKSVVVIHTSVDVTSYAQVAAQIAEWISLKSWGFICAANVHMIMEGYDAQSFQRVLNRSRLVVPDGMPLVWMLRASGYPDQPRVYGPTLMLEVCQAATVKGYSIGLFGGTQECLDQLQVTLKEKFSSLRIAYSYSPPFRAGTPAEEDRIIENINKSGISVLFVGLGCPKQEKWMDEHADRLNVIQIGVGAAFAFHAGLVRQAPRFLQRLGMEWVFRLCAEPRRLWFRYLYHNPRFACLVIWQLMKRRRINHGQSEKCEAVMGLSSKNPPATPVSLNESSRARERGK